MEVIKVKEIFKCSECGKHAELDDVVGLDNAIALDHRVIYAIYKCECGNKFKLIAGLIEVITKKELKRKTIDQILEFLQELSSNKPIKTNIPYYENVANEYGSDRGNYQNLYLKLGSNADNIDSETLINLLNNALDDGVMYGYKGGEFDIHEDTLVTLGSYGNVGKYIIDIKEEDDCVRLIAELD